MTETNVRLTFLGKKLSMPYCKNLICSIVKDLKSTYFKLSCQYEHIHVFMLHNNLLSLYFPVLSIKNIDLDFIAGGVLVECWWHIPDNELSNAKKRELPHSTARQMTEITKI